MGRPVFGMISLSKQFYYSGYNTRFPPELIPFHVRLPVEKRMSNFIAMRIVRTNSFTSARQQHTRVFKSPRPEILLTQLNVHTSNKAWQFHSALQIASALVLYSNQALLSQENI